jgi:hypothetical protein
MALPTLISTQLKPSQNPRLPAAPVEYDARYVDSLTSILRQYFNQVDNLTQSLLTNTGQRFMRAPTGSFYDTTSQTAAAANTAYLMTINSTDTPNTNAVSIVSGSKITVTYPGVYNFQFSVQIVNSNANTKDMSIWLKQGNGGGAATDIAGSTGLISIPGSHGGVDGHGIYGWNYFVSMQASDYIQLYWSTDSTNVSIKYYASGVSPTRPATSSVVATMTFVSAPLT